MTPQELKNSILQLAIQGKLVEQRPEEGNVVPYLAAIKTEREKQIKQKTAKARKNLRPVEEYEIPFDIPESWAWERFGNLANYIMGKTPPRAEEKWWGAGIPWISIADMPESGHVTHTKETITEAALSEKFGGRVSTAGTLLMSFKLTVGRVSILDINAVHNEAIISIYPYADADRALQQYLFYVLPFITQYGDSKNAIKGKTLNDTSIANLLIPVPPKAEQKRIVAKIKELFPCIDRYEQAWSRLETFNARFPDDMKKSLLQLAMQGKLVEQCPEEGTGEELYRQIQQEKQKLIKEGKLKKEKPLPVITEEEKPFEIPESWTWIRLGDVLQVISGVSYKKNDVCVNGIRILRGGNIQDGQIILAEDDVFLPLTYYDPSKQIQKWDIVIVASTGSKTVIGKAGYADRDIPKAMIGAFLRICRSYDFSIVPYLHYIFESYYYRKHIRDLSQGTNINNVKESYITEFLIPFPPLAEQRRIVAKLEQLLPLCEKLK